MHFVPVGIPAPGPVAVRGNVGEGIELEAHEFFVPRAVAAVDRPAVPQVEDVAIEESDVRSDRLVKWLRPGQIMIPVQSL